ncbi:hypothetical protein BKA81DRAFT_355418 [Phyllosticta paracitricarpa]|uniref:Uncharacterized protein n=1 Tax=Phyllosticta citricarpa TaxID=55181 RepID=A0ABR1MLD5_9PEZI
MPLARDQKSDHSARFAARMVGAKTTTTTNAIKGRPSSCAVRDYRQGTIDIPSVIAVVVVGIVSLAVRHDGKHSRGQAFFKTARPSINGQQSSQPHSDRRSLVERERKNCGARQADVNFLVNQRPLPRVCRHRGRPSAAPHTQPRHSTRSIPQIQTAASKAFLLP